MRDDWRTKTLLAVGAACIMVALQRPAARADAESASGTVPYLRVSIQGLLSSGGTAGEATAGWGLIPPGVVRTLIVAGGSAEVTDLCAGSSGGLTFQPGARVGWQVESKLLSADAAGARVWVRWRRNVLDRTVVDAADLQREYEVRLTEGTRHVLDLVRPAPGVDPRCDGAVVQMWLEFADSPELADSILDYEVWLVHRDAGGREVVDRTEGRGLQGKPVDYTFKRLRYTRAGVPDSSGDVEIQVNGSVKGRVRPDGRIDVSVDAGRMVMFQSLGSGEQGSKQATLANGETVEFELPQHHWMGDVFAGQRTAIRVTVRRVS